MQLLKWVSWYEGGLYTKAVFNWDSAVTCLSFSLQYIIIHMINFTGLKDKDKKKRKSMKDDFDDEIPKKKKKKGAGYVLYSGLFVEMSFKEITSFLKILAFLEAI